MLVGQVMEPIPGTTAADNTANRLADRIRNIWLDNQTSGNVHWEVDFFEDPDGIAFLRAEAFPYLQAIDYIFKWWNHENIDGLGGQLEVLWKVLKNGEMRMFKTTIRFAAHDFTLGAYLDENRKREVNRASFREAFEVWQKLYVEAIGE